MAGIGADRLPVMLDVVLVETLPGDVVRQELWPLYQNIFGDFADIEEWREQVWDRHSARGRLPTRTGATRRCPRGVRVRVHR